MKNKIIYEQPLNERMRSWLRLEYLFECVAYRLKGSSDWDSRAAIEGILEILAFVSRTDIKPDIIKGLEGQLAHLRRWQQQPQVDTTRLNIFLDKLQFFLEMTSALKGQFGADLLEHHLISSVKQRSNIPGGACRFDLPAYYHWLQKKPKNRHNDLLEWMNTFFPLREANELNLYLIRQNVLASHEIATAGFFQAKFDANTDFQMIRIILPHDSSYYPEMSGGKHRVTLRFLELSALQNKPIQTEQDVNFELCCCGAISA